MPEIGTSGSMSGDGKRGVAEWPKLPRPSSTLPMWFQLFGNTPRNRIRNGWIWLDQFGKLPSYGETETTRIVMIGCGGSSGTM